MKQENYKLLGDYIKEVNVRNQEEKITDPMGINIDKFFMPSVANVIGTDLSAYKLVCKNQFACNLMHVGRDERIPIALQTEDKSIIVSPAYYVFEITNTDVLLPNYLMIWFRRPEFDRNAWFYTDADVRGGLIKEAFLNMTLPIPDIDEQRKIVVEYQTVEQRIENNNRLIKALEETAQAIYHHTFVENIDTENLPEGWSEKGLEEVAKFKVGGDCPDVFSETKTADCKIPIYSNGEYLEGLYGYTDKAAITEDSFTISARGNVGKCFLRRHPYRGIVRLVSVIPINSKMLYYLYFNMSARNLQGDGSVQSQITVPQLSSEKIVVPNKASIGYFYDKCDVLFNNIESLKKEQLVLNKVKSLLLSKLS